MTLSYIFHMFTCVLSVRREFKHSLDKETFYLHVDVTGTSLFFYEKAEINLIFGEGTGYILCILWTEETVKRVNT